MLVLMSICVCHAGVHSAARWLGQGTLPGFMVTVVPHTSLAMAAYAKAVANPSARLADSAGT